MLYIVTTKGFTLLYIVTVTPKVAISREVTLSVNPKSSHEQACVLLKQCVLGSTFILRLL